MNDDGRGREFLILSKAQLDVGATNRTKLFRDNGIVLAVVVILFCMRVMEKCWLMYQIRCLFGQTFDSMLESSGPCAW